MPDAVASEYQRVDSAQQRLFHYRRRWRTQSGTWYVAQFSRTLTRVYDLSLERSSALTALTWICENEHVVRACERQVRHHLSAGFVRTLPVEIRQHEARAATFRVPRIQAVAAEIVDSSLGPLDLDLIRESIARYQQTNVLRLSELWALPMFLRIAVLDQLGLCADRLLEAGGTTASVDADDFLSAAIMSVRLLETVDWQLFVEQTSVVEAILSRDPAGVYAAMESKTRNDYRLIVEQVSRLTRCSEQTVAQACLSLATHAASDDPCRSHVGYYLLEEHRRPLYDAVKFRVPARLRITEFLDRRLALPYLAMIFLPPLVVAMLCGWWLIKALTSSVVVLSVSLALFLVLLTPCAQIVNRIIASLRPPRTLAKMDFSNGVPCEAKTIVVVPCLLSRTAVIEELLRNLELNYLCAKNSVAHFALLTDFADADKAAMPGDELMLKVATAGVESLNRRYSDNGLAPFALLHRRRLWNARENVWMGWERKRGKIEELNDWLRGADDSSMHLIVGDCPSLRSTCFVITLDADTRLVPAAARRLIGTLAHPLNRPVRENGELVRGYSLIQPRVQTEPGSANATRFSQLFAGDRSIDLYSSAVSDLYQDLFGEGIYAGKGIYDVDSFSQSLKGKIPTNLVLSHDLLEGLFARAAMASDISVMESCPENIRTHLQRAHRWIRGDWQLVTWALGRPRARSGAYLPFRPGAIGRWKLIDNLRRSLSAPLKLALLLMIWWWLPGNAWLWSALVLSGGPVGAILAAFDQTIHGNWRWGGIGDSLARVFAVVTIELRCWLHDIVFLPQKTLTALDAIGRSLFRQWFSKSQLLEWTVAAEVERRGDITTTNTALRVLWPAPVLALVVLVAVAFVADEYRWAAAPILALWLLAPFVGWYTAQADTPLIDAGSKMNTLRLRSLARETWRYFEELVGPESNWLPPDNVQYHKRRRIAYRSSPTNIGLYLMSAQTAWRLGYISLSELQTRIDNALNTLSRMQCYRGHLYNWYDIESLQALEPAYVSTVDSGNFVASLIALRQGIMGSVQQKWTGQAHCAGFRDTLSALKEQWLRLNFSSADDPVTAAIDRAEEYLARHQQPFDCTTALTELRDDYLPTIQAAVVAEIGSAQRDVSAAAIDNVRAWLSQLVAQLAAAINEHEDQLAWRQLILNRGTRISDNNNQHSLSRLQRLAETPCSLTEVSQVVSIACRLLQRVKDNRASDEVTRCWAADCRHALLACAESASLALERSKSLSDRLARWIAQTDFSFLFDRERELFHIGFSVSRGELDNAYYDLLASESRIASLVAIAKGDVPVSHWLHLARPITRIGTARILLSWSGTLFEYLMPALFMRGEKNGLLARSALQAIRRQQRFAQLRRLPWGISESAYRETDSEGTYQYRAFGSSELALSRQDNARVVISPYASLLSLPFIGGAIEKNLDALDRLGTKGRYGYYESLDFGSTRRLEPSSPQVVLAFMAHHQGMVLLALGNALLDDFVVDEFAKDTRVESVAYLLAESVPAARAVDREIHAADALPTDRHTGRSIVPWTVDSREHQLVAISNGRMSSIVSSAASGALHWEGLALTRDRVAADGPESGIGIFLKDIEREQVWRFGVDGEAEHRHISFAPHFAEFREKHNALTVRLRIAVAHDSDVELRHFSITNDADHARSIALTYCAEVCLMESSAFERHPAFQKLFVRSWSNTQLQAQCFQRRAVSPDEHPMFLGQMVCSDAEVDVSCFTHSDWARFRGRLRPLKEAPGLLESPVDQPAESGTSLDPMMGATIVLNIPPRQTLQCAFVTAVAADEERLLACLSRYRSAQRMRWAQAQAEVHMARTLDDINATSEDYCAAMRMYAECIWQEFECVHPSPTTARIDDGIQSSLWRFGISGDLPLIGVAVQSEADLGPMEVILRRLNCLRYCGTALDLLVLDSSRSGYAKPVRHKLDQLVDKARTLAGTNVLGSIYVIGVRDVSAPDLANLRQACTPIKDARAWVRSAEEPALRRRDSLPFVPLPSSPVATYPALALPQMTALKHAAGTRGGFTEDDAEYVINLASGDAPPRPWVNVLANPDFGSVVTDSGGSFTWWGNSSEYRLTPWYNDAVSDRSGEAIYLRDEETGDVWSPAPAPARDALPYRIRHGAGYTRFEHASNGLMQCETVFVDTDEPVKVIELALTNHWPRQRRLTATLAVEWVMGNNRDRGGRHIAPALLPEHNGFLLRNTFARNEASNLAFVAASEPLHGFSTQRAEFLGAENDWANPRGLRAVGMSDRIESGSGGFTACMIHLDIAAGATVRCHFVIGAADSREAALERIGRFSSADMPAERLHAVQGKWDELLGQCQITTPVPQIDTMINRWSLYQALSSRLWGRAGFYQTGGGYGFRDQLQDSLALLAARPELVRRQILLAAERQFPEGDVLHWWHENPLRGVRTRCSDDLLWLPYVVERYVDATGDCEILNARIRFLGGDRLQDDEHERYAEFEVSNVDATLYEHCCRAIDARMLVGRHGLPFIGTGDWNDGLSRVGIQGEGESVWLGWFLIRVCNDFAGICDAEDDPGRGNHYRAYAKQLESAITANGWDGQWYVRGYYDDGSPLGSADSDECQIDLNAQSWSVLAADTISDRARIAMASVSERLEDKEHQLLKLLAPPFANTNKDPGYIKTYPPGVRENGGQYSHAAVWAAWAAAEAGQPERALRWAQWMNPVSRMTNESTAARYGCEPYAMVADIYSGNGYLGRGGWSWYTGTAGWWHRLIVEQLLGLKRRGDRLYIQPKLPASWPGFSVDYRTPAGVVLHIVVQLPDEAKDDDPIIFVNDQKQMTDFVSLSDVEPASRPFDQTIQR